MASDTAYLDVVYNIHRERIRVILTTVFISKKTKVPKKNEIFSTERVNRFPRSLFCNFTNYGKKSNTHAGCIASTFEIFPGVFRRLFSWNYAESVKINFIVSWKWCSILIWRAKIFFISRVNRTYFCLRSAANSERYTIKKNSNFDLTLPLIQ